ncbi:GNAT family N-acetyltransferase [Solwaraspora sp. WMMB335]|uniref:GNAT family N-acetyltransferase n=1 Tax=Solwaraspora sp. WMMB335 TaxID=3404118 RepID=UPI003B96110E
MPADVPQALDAAVTCHVSTFADLDAVTLYRLLRLRVDVFVVEQQCPYPELDGRDTEASTRHVWLSRDDAVVAYLRVLDESTAVRIGRVVVAAAERGRGHAGRLMAAALRLAGARTCVLEAQAHLAGFYRRFGFTVTGARYVEDGIAHVPMRRTIRSDGEHRRRDR